MAEKSNPGKKHYQAERVVQTYLNPHFGKIFTAYAFTQKEHRSSVSKVIIKKFFASMSDREINLLLKLYNEMTPEQRKNPGKIDL